MGESTRSHSSVLKKMNRPANHTTIIKHLLVLAIFLLPQAASFQHPKLSNPHHHAPISKIKRKTRVVPFPENDALLESSSKRNQQPSLPIVLLSAAFGLCLCGTPQLASGADTVSPLSAYEETKMSTTSTTIPSLLVSNYASQVFSSPFQTHGAIPSPTDPKYDNRDARNRAYDQAFQQDARDRDAAYGKMAVLKREQALQEVQLNRRALGLDGDGDVRPRVGDAKVAGMASLKEYLLEQDPSTLTPEELQVYQRMKGAE